jgi:hypothetical protein
MRARGSGILPPFGVGDRVRITRLSSRLRTKSGPADLNVGDVGAIRFVLQDSAGELIGYIAERVVNGIFERMADFTPDELEGASGG